MWGWGKVVKGGDALYVQCSHANPPLCSDTAHYSFVATPTYYRPHPPTTGHAHLSVPLDDGDPLANVLRGLMVGYGPLDLRTRNITIMPACQC